ncbi:MAG: sigma-70 family RNA polymerase sigma factor [Myxococcales bacterium]|nr:sigma-70 family RNA polymerase sigma factor [Myxococcales bacterium]
MRGRASDDARRTVYWPDMERVPATSALWSAAEDAARQQLARRRARAVRLAIATALTARQREAIELYFFEGLSQQAIARRLGVSQQVIHRRIHGARRGGRQVGGALARLRAALRRELMPVSHDTFFELEIGNELETEAGAAPRSDAAP